MGSSNKKRTWCLIQSVESLKKGIAFCFTFFCLYTNSISQPVELSQEVFNQELSIDDLEFTLISAYQLANINSNFRSFGDSINCCSNYYNGSGYNYFLGFSTHYKLNKQHSIGISFIYKFNDHSFEETEKTLLNFNGKDIEGQFKYIGEFEVVQLMGIGLSYNYNINENLFLNLNISAIETFRTQFNSYEKIESEVAVFKDTKTKIRNQQTYKTDSTYFSAFSYVSLAYKLPLNKNKTVYLLPNINIGYEPNFLSLDYTVLSYGIGLNLGINLN